MSEIKIPYITVEVPKELEKLIGITKPEWFESDGLRIFKVTDEEGKPTNKCVSYLLLRGIRSEVEINFLYCHNCGKCVSTGFTPVPTDTPDKGLIVRAWIECPECIEKKWEKKDELDNTQKVD